MKAAQKATGRTMSMPGGLAFGGVISLAITVIGAVLLSKLMDTETIEWEGVGYGIMVLLTAASFLGALSAYSRIRRQRLVVCLLSGAIYWITLLGITALFFGGQYEAVGVTAGLILAGCGCAGMLALPAGRGGKRKKIH